jgi:L-arabinokinase
MSAFPRIEDVPLVARKPRLGKTEARHALTLADETVVLLSFGGVGLPGFRTEVLADLEGFHFLSSLATSADPPNVTAVNAATLERIGLGYEDLVAAADVVVTKPGYGIVTDAIAARTRMVYTERGDFAEYPVLVEGMAEYLPCVHVSNVDLRAGRLRPVLDQVLRMPFPPVPRLDGAQVAAQRIVGMGGFA